MITPADRQKHRRRAVIGVVIAGTVAACAGYALFYSGFFSIRLIDCREGDRACSPDVMAELERHRGENTLFFNASAAALKIEKANFSLHHVKITAELPQTLRASLSARVPFVQFANSQAPREVWFADRDGMVIESGERSAVVPLVLSNEILTLTVGEKLSQKLIAAGGIVDALDGSIDGNTPSVIDSDMLEVRTREGSVVRFSLSKPSSEQLSTLQLVQNQARIEGTSYREIDVRFSEPIVKK